MKVPFTPAHSLRIAQMSVLSLLMTAAVVPALVAPGAGAATRPLSSVPAGPAGATLLGPVPATTSMSVDVVLRPRSQAALDAFVTAVSTPSSPDYGHYLARGQFGGRFGASAASIGSVLSALREDGLAPGPVDSDDLIIPVTASAAQLSHAFGVTLARWRLSSGRVAYDSSGRAQLANAPAGALLGVVGLSDVAELQPRLVASHARVSLNGAAKACPAALAVTPEHQGLHNNGVPGDHFLTVDALMKAYGADPLYVEGDLGQHTTVDVYEGESNFPSDITIYESCFGIHAQVNYIKIDGGAPAPSVANEDGLESELDIETIAAAAPDSTINVYQTSGSDSAGLTQYATMVGDDNAQVISTSWGLCEDVALAGLTGTTTYLQAESEIFEQAAAQGTSVLAAAGDSGSQDCGLAALPTTVDPLDPVDYQAVDDPASDPYVTGVGGTHLKVTAANTRSSETVWNDGPSNSASARGAGGGGPSHVWAMPSWQYETLLNRGWLPSASAPRVFCPVSFDPSDNPYCREVPDVTADADPGSGLVVYWAGSWTHVGGTSAGAPQWAGLTALADSCAMAHHHGLVGFLNPALYAIAAVPSLYAEAFTDISSGNNDYVIPSLHPEGYVAGEGYDMASGLGAPDAGTGGTGVVDQLCTGSPIYTTTTATAGLTSAP